MVKDIGAGSARPVVSITTLYAPLTKFNRKEMYVDLCEDYFDNRHSLHRLERLGYSELN